MNVLPPAMKRRRLDEEGNTRQGPATQEPSPILPLAPEHLHELRALLASIRAAPVVQALKSADASSTLELLKAAVQGSDGDILTSSPTLDALDQSEEGEALPQTPPTRSPPAPLPTSVVFSHFLIIRRSFTRVQAFSRGRNPSGWTGEGAADLAARCGHIALFRSGCVSWKCVSSDACASLVRTFHVDVLREMAAEVRQQLHEREVEETALDFCYTGCVESLRVLLADVRPFFSYLGLERILEGACRWGRADCVRVLLEAGVTPSARTLYEAVERGFADCARELAASDKLRHAKEHSLTLAVRWDHIECLEVLHVEREVLNGLRIHGLPLLAWAVSNGSPHAVQALLRKGADVNAVDESGMTPLMHAVDVDRIACWLRSLPPETRSRRARCNVRALLAAGANVDATDSAGRSALWVAATCGLTACVRDLIDARANVDHARTGRRTPLHLAAERGFVECLKALLEAGASVEAADQDGKTPLHMAVRARHVNCVKALIRAGAHVDRVAGDGSTPLHVATDFGCLQALLEAGANVEAARQDGYAPLHVAVRAGPVECVEALIRAGADVDRVAGDGSTPLLLGAMFGKAKCLQALLEAGANANAALRNDGTALHQAALHGHEECLTTLMHAGADVQHTSDDGWTALLVAAQHGQVSALRVLLQAGAHIDAIDTSGENALHKAAAQGHVACIKELLRGPPVATEAQGARAVGTNAHTLRGLLDAKDAQGRTPLLRACESGHTKCVHELLSGGAGVALEANDGTSPLVMAARRGILEMAQILAAAEARE